LTGGDGRVVAPPGREAPPVVGPAGQEGLGGGAGAPMRAPDEIVNSGQSGDVEGTGAGAPGHEVVEERGKVA